VRTVDSFEVLAAVDQSHPGIDLDVDLIREVSWSNMRDKLNIGVFDAAHLIAPVAIASSLGLGHVKVPIVAGIQGIAAGAGSVIALASDFRVCTTRAKFAFLFTKVGLSGGDMGAAYLLPRLVGYGRATELLMLGDTIDAETADRYGLVTQLTDDLDGACAALARRLADGPTLGLQQTKSLITRELDMPIGPAMELDAMTQALLMTTRDHAEFHAAFNEKRKPDWKGR